MRINLAKIRSEKKILGIEGKEKKTRLNEKCALLVEKSFCRKK